MFVFYFSQNLRPIGDDLARLIGGLPENKDRNRFSNILPCKLCFEGGNCIQRWIWCSYKKTSKKVFSQQPMYAHSLKRVSKTAKFWKNGMLFNPWNFDTCFGYDAHSSDFLYNFFFFLYFLIECHMVQNSPLIKYFFFFHRRLQSCAVGWR